MESVEMHAALVSFLDDFTSPDPIVQRRNLQQFEALASVPHALEGLLGVLHRCDYPIARRLAAAAVARRLLRLETPALHDAPLPVLFSLVLDLLDDAEPRVQTAAGTLLSLVIQSGPLARDASLLTTAQMPWRILLPALLERARPLGTPDLKGSRAGARLRGVSSALRVVGEDVPIDPLAWTADDDAALCELLHTLLHALSTAAAESYASLSLIDAVLRGVLACLENALFTEAVPAKGGRRSWPGGAPSVPLTAAAIHQAVGRVMTDVLLPRVHDTARHAGDLEQAGGLLMLLMDYLRRAALALSGTAPLEDALRAVIPAVVALWDALVDRHRGLIMDPKEEFILASLAFFTDISHLSGEEEETAWACAVPSVLRGVCRLAMLPESTLHTLPEHTLHLPDTASTVLYRERHTTSPSLSPPETEDEEEEIGDAAEDGCRAGGRVHSLLCAPVGGLDALLPDGGARRQAMALLVQNLAVGPTAPLLVEGLLMPCLTLVGSSVSAPPALCSTEAALFLASECIDEIVRGDALAASLVSALSSVGAPLLGMLGPGGGGGAWTAIAPVAGHVPFYLRLQVIRFLSAMVTGAIAAVMDDAAAVDSPASVLLHHFPPEGLLRALGEGAWTEVNKTVLVMRLHAMRNVLSATLLSSSKELAESSASSVDVVAPLTCPGPLSPLDVALRQQAVAGFRTGVLPLMAHLEAFPWEARAILGHLVAEVLPPLLRCAGGVGMEPAVGTAVLRALATAFEAALAASGESPPSSHETVALLQALVDLVAGVGAAAVAPALPWIAEAAVHLLRACRPAAPSGAPGGGLAVDPMEMETLAMDLVSGACDGLFDRDACLGMGETAVEAWSSVDLLRRTLRPPPDAAEVSAGQVLLWSLDRLERGLLERDSCAPSTAAEDATVECRRAGLAVLYDHLRLFPEVDWIVARGAEVCRREMTRSMQPRRADEGRRMPGRQGVPVFPNVAEANALLCLAQMLRQGRMRGMPSAASLLLSSEEDIFYHRLFDHVVASVSRRTRPEAVGGPGMNLALVLVETGAFLLSVYPEQSSVVAVVTAGVALLLQRWSGIVPPVDATSGLGEPYDLLGSLGWVIARLGLRSLVDDGRLARSALVAPLMAVDTLVGRLHGRAASVLVDAWRPIAHAVQEESGGDLRPAQALALHRLVHAT